MGWLCGVVAPHGAAAYVQVPDYVLAQVDSIQSGGKTGVIHPGGKNLKLRLSPAGCR